MKRTPLYDRHVALGARTIDFGGWDMPVRYRSEREEHLAVRQAVGLFDVSHMGEVFLEGNDALALVQRLFTNDAAALADGQAMYAGMLNERGTFIDDCVVYRFSSERFLVCVNAGNREKDASWMQGVVAREFAGAAVVVRDESDAWAQIAVQGPQAESVVAAVAGPAAAEIAPYHFAEMALCVPGATPHSIVARTGYTGEDGFELYVPTAAAPALWDTLLEVAQPLGGLPCGLAARDTLRLEAGMALYGNDIDEERTPLEAGLSWVVKWHTSPRFIGAEALEGQRASGPSVRLRGLEMAERGIPRAGYRVLGPGQEPIGQVTSGTQAPFLGRPIAMAYLDMAHAAPGTEVAVEIRGVAVPARVVALPFYRRPRPAAASRG